MLKSICPSQPPPPPAVWLLQPGSLEKILRILRYRFNQILTINNSFEILQPVFFQDCTTLKCTWRKYCSSVESNASSLINSLHGVTTPTWFLESTSARDEMNVKWFYRPVLLVDLSFEDSCRSQFSIKCLQWVVLLRSSWSSGLRERLQWNDTSCKVTTTKQSIQGWWERLRFCSLRLTLSGRIQ